MELHINAIGRLTKGGKSNEDDSAALDLNPFWVMKENKSKYLK